MTLTLAPVTGFFPQADGNKTIAQEVQFELSSEGIDTLGNATIPVRRIAAQLDEEGRFSVGLWPNSRGATDTYYRISLLRRPSGTENGWRRELGTIQVPESGGDVADLLSVGHTKLPGVLVSVVPEGDYHKVVAATETAKAEADRSVVKAEAAEMAASLAVNSAEASRRWANEAQNTEVEPGRFSALHYQARAEEIFLDAEKALATVRLETASRFNTVSDFMRAAQSGALNDFPDGAAFSAVAEGVTYLKESANSEDRHIDFCPDGGIALRVVARDGVLPISAFDPEPNAKDALGRAVRAMNLHGHRLRIDVPIEVAYETFEDIPKLADGAHLIFDAPITMKTFGVPVMWHENDGTAGNVTFERPQFRYSGTAQKTRPQLMIDFYNRTWTSAAPYSNRAQAALLFFRGSRVRIVGDFEARATDFSAPEKLIPRAFVMLRGPNGEAGNVYAGDFHFDGILFGIIGTGIDDFWIGDVYSDRWSQLDTSAYEWEAPAHVWYFTPNESGEYNIRIGNCYDSGREVGVPYVTGATSYKCTTRASTFQTGFLFSRRSQGIADLEVASASIGGGYWDGSLHKNSQLGGGKVARFADFNSGGSISVNFGSWFFRVPEDYNDYVQIDATRASGRFMFDVPGTKMGVPFIQGVMNRCDFDISLLMSQSQDTSHPVAVRIEGGGAANRFRIRTDSPQWDTLRVISQDKVSSSGNSVEIFEITTGSRRMIANFYEFQEVFFSEQVSATAGPAVSTKPLVPKGANLRSLSTRVVEALGQSGGISGYSVGTLGESSLFGSSGTGVNNGTDDKNWSRDASGWQKESFGIRLAALGGTFDGLGLIQVSGCYTSGSRNHDLV